MFIRNLPGITALEQNHLEAINSYSHIHSWIGYSALIIFCAAYLLVILEEKIHLKKSIPVIFGASLIWIIICVEYIQEGQVESVKHAIELAFEEYGKLFFFLLVAMTYINAMIERGVFSQMRLWLVSKGFSYRKLFWFTGLLAFFISPVADNLTTALLMCSVVLAVGENNPRFVSLSCINIVVAANAGGAFSPFGDITTLMVWQQEVLTFWEFFVLFFPALVSFVALAFVMQFFIPKLKLSASTESGNLLKPGAITVIVLFLLTIVTAVSFHQFLHLPPVFGMLTGLAYLQLFSYFAYIKNHRSHDYQNNTYNILLPETVFDHIGKSEWDTLLFFYGIMMAVGGLGFLGYLHVTSVFLYGEFDHTVANIFVGLLSSIVDNIPVMYAVLTMNPEMTDYQWLLATFTVGVGGSLLSIGSAAGVALMGQARGNYTFFSHLKWTPLIAVTTGMGVFVHYLISG